MKTEENISDFDTKTPTALLPLFLTIGGFLPTIPVNRCAKCGGTYIADQAEKRIVCVNCGAGKYYGIPQLPAGISPSTWPLATVKPPKKYKPYGAGAIIELGRNPSHFVDKGCREARRCQDCPLPSVQCTHV